MTGVEAIGGSMFNVRKLVAVATSAVDDASVARSHSVASVIARSSSVASAIAGSHSVAVTAGSIVAASVAGISTANIGKQTAQRNGQQHRKAIALN